jgi:hypothetical protein
MGKIRASSTRTGNPNPLIVNEEAERIQSEGDADMDQGSKESYITCPVCEL